MKGIEESCGQSCKELHRPPAWWGGRFLRARARGEKQLRISVIDINRNTYLTYTHMYTYIYTFTLKGLLSLGSFELEEKFQLRWIQ